MIKNLFQRLIGTTLIGIGLSSCNLFVNRPPVVVPILNRIYEGQNYNCQVQAYDPEFGHLDYFIECTPVLSSSPEWINPLSVDSLGRITGTAPIVDKDTDYLVKLMVSDGTDTTIKDFDFKVMDTSFY